MSNGILFLMIIALAAIVVGLIVDCRLKKEEIDWLRSELARADEELCKANTRTVRLLLGMKK